MPWNDRLRQAAYTSPSGIRLDFSYEDVSSSIEKKTSAFEFPDANGTYVQDLGNSGRRFPLRFFFWGADCDLEAEAFESALSEKGIGKLDHPIYGTRDVVPFGSISRQDNLKTAANQVIISCDLLETIGLVYPSPQTDPLSSVLAAIAEYNQVLSATFGNFVNLNTTSQRVTFRNETTALLASTETVLTPIADSQEDVSAQFNAITDSINQSIDLLIEEPETLSAQTVQAIQSPARALTSISSRLDAYNRLISALISGDGAVLTLALNVNNSNIFHSRDMYATSYVSASVLSAINHQFRTRSEALSVAEFILMQLDDVTDWREANFESLSQIDTGQTYQKLQDAVAICAGFLVEISFSLLQERRITLTRNRTIIDLVAELYGSVDDQLDFFISSNNLSGSEILELKRGREIVYYI